jgi:hypothetical protein
MRRSSSGALWRHVIRNWLGGLKRHARLAMLKITRIGGENSALTLKLEGKLLEPWVAELLKASTLANGFASRIRLDLADLMYVDKAGAIALKELIGRGYSVSACSGYVAELLHLEVS